MKHKICIVGELNVDFIVRGEDLTPQWNTEKIIDSCQLALGSSSAITACILAGLGAEVRFVSIIGDDEFGRFSLRELERMNVNTEYVIVREELQTGCTVSLSTAQDRALLTAMGTIGDVRPEHVPQACWNDAHHLHFGSYFLQHGMRPHWHQLFAEAQAAGLSTSFDLGWDPAGHWHSEAIQELLKSTTLFMPSEVELMHMMDSSSLDQALAGLPQERGIVAVKRGSKGALMSEGDTLLEVPPFNVKPVDTTGAGDSFNAGMIFGWQEGYRGEELLTFANACGAMAVTRVGGTGTPPSLQEVKAFIETAGRR